MEMMMSLSTTYDLDTWEHPRGILESYGFSPLKSLGQNFLIEKNTLKFICEQSKITENNVILEIGPGTGALTHLLSSLKLPMLCVEYDKGLAAHVTKRYSSEYLDVVHGDILESKEQLHPQAKEFIHKHYSSGKKVKLISNLPYKILTPLLWILFDCANQWEEGVFLVQKEFADKLNTSFNTKSYTPLSVITSLYFNISVLRTVGNQQFWPAPEVTSAIIKITPKEGTVSLNKKFVAFLKCAFSQRRKSLYKLIKTLGISPETLETSFNKLKIDKKSRAEQLTPQQHLDLFSLVYA